MEPADRKQRVRRAFEDLGRGNLGTLLDLLAADIVYTLIGNTAISRTLHGRDAVLQKLLMPVTAALVPPLTFEIQSLTADDERVVMQALGHATTRAGAPYHNTYCFVFRFAGQLVSEVTEYLDTALVTRTFSIPTERDALLRAMDLNMSEMFRETTRLGRGSELLETPQFWMAFNPRGTHLHNMVMIRDAVDADVLFAAVREFYVRRDRVFSIWTRAHADAALETDLRERGFSEFTSMPGMVLLGDPGTRCQPDGLKIRPATTDQGRRDYLHVTAEAYATYGAPREYADDAFVSLESVCAPHVQGFVGYVDGKPATVAAVYVTHGAAGIGWVGTMSEYRGHGFAEAVTWAAIREGFRRGGGFANLQASPMGRPIYERMGFITPTEYHVLVGSL
jgi:ketosteroid isomerase-like protein/ribosomal protein S18 acetylase RimI-like enzyme